MLTLLSVIAVTALGAEAFPSNANVLDKRLPNGLGKTPALGWNSWVSSVSKIVLFFASPNVRRIKEAATLLQHK